MQGSCPASGKICGELHFSVIHARDAIDVYKYLMEIASCQPWQYGDDVFGCSQQKNELFHLFKLGKTWTIVDMARVRMVDRGRLLSL